MFDNLLTVNIDTPPIDPATGPTIEPFLESLVVIALFSMFDF